MKINSIRYNTAFNGILINKGYKSPKQIEIIEEITERIIDSGNKENARSKSIVEDLERQNTDIFIAANNDRNTVDLELLSHAGLYYNFVPYSEKGERIKYKIGLLTNDGLSNKRNIIENRFKVNSFIKDASNLNLHNVYNVGEINRYEKIAERDMMNNEISKAEILPNARCVYGTKQITTKDFVQRHYGTT